MNIPTKKYEFHISDSESKVLSLLKGKVFHTTKKESLESIISSGSIRNSKSLREEGISYSYAGQSDHSYAFINSFVSLVDLRTANDNCIIFQNSNYPFLNLPADSKTNCFLILSETQYDNLILEEKALEDFPNRDKVWLPKIECWIANEIPIDYIKEIIEVEFDHAVEDLEMSEEQIQIIEENKKKLDEVWAKRKAEIEPADNN